MVTAKIRRRIEAVGALGEPDRLDRNTCAEGRHEVMQLHDVR